MPATSSPFTESNRRPSPYHGDALPTELKGRSPRKAYSLVLLPGDLETAAAEQPDTGSTPAVPDGEPGVEAVRRKRSAEQIALRDLAPELDQTVAAALVLDPLGHD